ncbi:MAG TPA: EAL domain-containing protein, partial [Epsilonproteobacteria bacterium]|nr:EAL domain-containing protein [Campylobacterota bacterium]
MDHFEKKLFETRSKIVNTTLLVLSILIVPTILFSLMRALETGWKPVMYLQVLIGIGVIAFTRYRHTVTYPIRAGIILFISYIAGITGLLQWGLMSAATPFIIVLVPLSLLFLGKRVALFSALLTLISLLFIANYFVSGSELQHYDLTDYFTSALSWTNFIMTLTFTMVVFSIILFNFDTSLSTAYQTLEEHETRLKEKVEEQTGQLIAQNEEFESIFMLSKGGLALINAEGNFLKVNHTYREMLGYSEEELLGQSCVALSLEEEQELSRMTIETILYQGYIDTFEKRCYHADGSVITVTVSGSLMPDKKHIILSTKNFTHEERLRQEIHNQKERYHQLLTLSTDGIFLIDMQGRLIECSNQSAKMLGYTMQEMRSLSVSDWDAGQTDEEVLQHIRNTPTEPIGFETQHKKKDGTVYDVSVRSVRVTLNGQEYVYATVRDISNEKRLRTQYETLINDIGGRYVLFSNTHSVINFISKGSEVLFGQTPEQITGKRFQSIVNWTPESLNLALHETIRQIRRNREYAEFEMCYYDNRQVLHTLFIVQHIRYSRQQKIISIDGLIEDITHKKEQERETKRLQTIIDEFVPYVKTDTKGTIISASKSFYTEFRIDNIAENLKINLFKPEETLDPHYQKLWQTLKSGKVFEHDIQNNHFNREKHWYHVKIVPQFNQTNTITGYIAFYHNIDEKVHLTKEIHTDPLTKLTNRKYLQYIQDKINFHEYDVVMIDIDHFKKINDNFGHQAGDMVLQRVADSLQHHIRQEDTLIRYGGEEFLLLLHNPTKNINVTTKISERMRVNVQDSLREHKDLYIKPTISIGIEPHTERTRNLEEAILHADEMLYMAKRKGRNRIEIYEENRVASLEVKSTKKYSINDIKHAIDEKKLICHYQPIVNTEREIVMYESLVRLIDDRGKMIMPGDFLYIIKNTNIYVDMTKQVLGYNFKFFEDKAQQFTINLSVSDLLNDSVQQIVMNKLARFPDMAQYLTIELLEDEIIEDLEGIKRVMEKLRTMGVRFAIDDFGSGYANFGNIFKLEFDFLKINGELIRHIDVSEYSRNMVESLCSFAKKANVTVIAEYVENEKIFEYAKKYH